MFIDGEAGTTGLRIADRLAVREDIDLVSIAADRRKDAAARREALNAADVVILCLPDEAARQAVDMIDNPAVRVIDASSAHRTTPGWTYGFPEMTEGQRAAIAGARRVSNPGCYATAFIALVRPLVASGLLPAATPLSAHGVSGYSGGGKAMIAEFEAGGPAFRAYSLGRRHKHVPEMREHALLAHAPLFSPSVGRFARGMIVEVPLARAPAIGDIQGALADAYRDEAFVEVASREETRAASELLPDALNGTNRLRLHVFGAEDAGQASLVAVLDNLGKGAAGAALQNLNLMLGLEEGLGL
jgi:N-acetyl-gamma-glutamyl-phosphate reductase